MKLEDSIKGLINATFANSKFMGRNKDIVLATLNMKIKGSENMCLMPEIQDISIERLDNLRDKLTLIWDDYRVEGVVTWRQSSDGRNYIFVNYN